MNVRHAFSYTVSASVLASFINFISQIYFARTLGVEGITPYAYGFIITNVVTLISSFGVNQVAIALGHTEENIVDAAILQFRIFLVIITIAIIFLSLSLVLNNNYSLVFLISSISVAGFSVSLIGHISNIKLEATMQYGKIATIRSIAYISASFTGVTLVFIFENPLALAIRDLTFGLIFSLTSALMAGKPMMLLLKQGAPWKKITNSSNSLNSSTLKNWLAMLGNISVLRVDYILSSLLLGPNLFGYYYQMRSLVDGSLTIFLNAIQSVLFSHYATTDVASISKKWLKDFFILFIMIAAFSSTAAFLVGAIFVDVILGPAWSDGSPALLGLAAYAVLRIYSETLTTMARAIFAHRILIISQLVWGISLSLLLPIFISYGGLMGSGIASALSALIASSFLSLLLAKRDINPNT